MAKGRSSKAKKPSGAKEAKDGSTKVSANDAEPAIVPDAGAVSKEGQWSIVRVIPSDERIPCQNDGCKGNSVATWSSTLDANDTKDVCESCQLKEFGDLPEDVNSGGGDDVAPNQEPELDAPNNKVDVSNDIEEGPAMETDEDHSAMEGVEMTKDAVPVTQDVAIDAEKPEDGAKTIATVSTAESPMSVNDHVTTGMEVEGVVSQTATDSSPTEGGDDEEESWDLTKILSHSEIQERPIKCSTDKCRLACSVWESNTSSDQWYSCIDCQTNDFGGWPEAHELPIKAMAEEHRRIIAAKCSKKKSPVMPVFAEEALSTTKDDTDMLVDGSQAEASDAVKYDDEEKWDLKKILSHADIQERPIKCSTDNCRLLACSLWVSNASSDKWYSCIDCQTKDFGGWPKASELPIKALTEADIRTLATKCSKKKSPAMPEFTDESLSPTKTGNGGPATNTVTPPPNSLLAGTEQATKQDSKSTITPTPGRPPQMSAGALKMHREWQKQAEKVGGPEARIVVKKTEAKPLIFNFLYDSFRPMNITQIHTGLKAVVPSPVLKSCLDEMALDRNDNPFDESDDEEEGAKAKKDDKATADDPYASSLGFKAGRNANTCLYFIDHTKQKNNGDGLEPDQRSELATNLAKADSEQSALKAGLQRMTAETSRLLSEPTNEEGSATLKIQEDAMVRIRDELEAARKLKVNEKHKKQTKKRIDSMAAQWRKRKRLAMDFLLAMEESTEGTVSVRKCLAGDGQIEIDSDEAAIEGQLAFAKKKRSRGPPAKKKKVLKGMAGSKKHQEAPSVTSGFSADESFVAVKLDGMGQVRRVYLDEGE